MPALNQVDLIILIIIFLFTLAGLYKGLLRSLIELLISGISMFIGWLYYRQTHLILKTFLVIIVAFLGLSILKWIALAALRTSRKTDSSPSRPTSTLNHLLGGVFGLLWGGLIAAFLALAIEILPLPAITNYNLEQQIQTSAVSRLLKRVFPLERLAFFERLRCLGKVSADPQAKARLTQQAQFQELLKNKSFRELNEDPQTLKQLQEQDISGLLNNPKFHRLLNDGELLEQLLKIDFEQALSGSFDKSGNQ